MRMASNSENGPTFKSKLRSRTAKKHTNRTRERRINTKTVLRFSVLVKNTPLVEDRSPGQKAGIGEITISSGDTALAVVPSSHPL